MVFGMVLGWVLGWIWDGFGWFWVQTVALGGEGEGRERKGRKGMEKGWERDAGDVKPRGGEGSPDLKGGTA